jgi:LemA protein
MVTMDEGVKAQWKQLEVVYQRRMDLIPNLVNTVQGYADFEKSTLTAVIEARASATKVTLDPSKFDEESVKKFSEAQTGLSAALSRLMVVAEQYPDLKANQNFLALQAELEGTENRIAREREVLKEKVEQYNVGIRTFPRNIYAGLFGFKERFYFEAQDGAEKAPDVKFNTK